MKTLYFHHLKTLSILLLVVHAAGALAQENRVAGAGSRTLPLAFEKNVGQSGPSTDFVARASAYQVSLRSSGVQLARSICASSSKCTNELVRLRLVYGSTDAAGIAEEELPGRVNYYVGNQVANWHTDIPTFSRVKYRSVYPGIDVVYYGANGHLEFDFVVAPHADPHRIEMELDGISKTKLDKSGDLITETALGLKLQAPKIYQLIDGQRRDVNGKFLLTSRRHIRFQIGSYDHESPLMIDPVVSYSTYLGGSGRDEAAGIGLDSSGNVIVAGTTTSTDFPIASAAQGVNNGSSDFVITKLNGSGTALLYSTYLGGSSMETAGAIAVDAQGNAYVTGTSDSTNFPTTPGAFATTCSGVCNTPVVAKLSPNGILLFSTYIGGGNTAAGAIAVDSAGNSYITGTTASDDFPVVNAFQPTYAGSINTSSRNAFVAKLNASGTGLLFSTYLGGVGESGGRGIAVDSSGSAYVVGSTNSDFPVKNPLTSDGGAFLTKFTPDGSALVFSTLLGQGLPTAIAVDSQGNAYIAGTTSDSNFPLTLNAFSTTCGSETNPSFTGPANCAFPYVYVQKVLADGSGLSYSTLIGEGNSAGIAVDPSGNAYLTGSTGGVGFPIVTPVQSTSQQSSAPGADAFVTNLNAAGTPVFSTYLGGFNTGDYGVGIAIDSSGSIFVAGSTSGSSNSATPDFPIVKAIQSTMTCCGVNHLFIIKIASSQTAALSVSPRAGSYVELRNLSSVPVTINSISLASLNAPNNCVGTLAAGAVCEITTKQSGTLSVNSSAPGSPQQFTVAGNLSGPILKVSDFFVTFPSQLDGTASAPRVITVKNVGMATSSITGVVVNGDYTQTNNCGASLPPQSSCHISVTFQPVSPRTPGGNLGINHDSTNEYIPLVGADSASALLPSTGYLSFGTQLFGIAGLSRVVTLTNSSATSLSPGAISVTGEFAETNTCSAPLGPHQSCRVALTFSPSSNGNRDGLLTIVDATNGGAASVKVHGVGKIKSDLSVSPFDLDYQTVPLGGGFAAPVQLTNVSSSILQINGITVDSDYSQTNNCGSTLGPGQSCTVSVSFAPTAVGPRNGTLLVSHSGLGSPQNVNLTGSGRPPLAVNPTKLEFGTWSVGATSDSQWVSIGNGSPPAVTINGAVASGDFAVESNNCTTVIFSSCVILVTYHPSSPGPGSGELTINTSDPASPYTVDLAGNGTAGPVFQIMAPNGGEQWQAGTSHSITWTYTGTPAATVNVELWKNTWLNPQIIGSNVPVGVSGAGSFDWAIPINLLVASDYRIRVVSTANDHFRDFSDTTFSVTPPRQLLLTSPAQSATLFEGGTQLPVFWRLSGTNLTTTVAIELWKGGVVQSLIATGVPVGSPSGAFTFGGYNWNVPANMVTGTDYRIRIRSEQEEDLFDDNDSDLTLYPAFSLTITSPNGGESWDLGTTHSVTWNFTGNPAATVQVQLISDTNPSGIDLGFVSVATGALTWAIPSNWTMGDYKIRVRRTSPPFTDDVSDTVFRLRGTGIIFKAPANGTFWQPGSTQTIRWIYGAGTPATLRISLQTGVAPATILVDNIPIGANGNGQFDWSIPANIATGFYNVLLFAGGTTQFLTESQSFKIDVNKLTLTSPNGGGLWRPGSHQGAQWFIQGDVGNTVSVQLLKTGIQVAVLASGVAASPNGIGFDVPNGLTAGSDYRVRVVSDQDQTFSDTSDADFTIADKYSLSVSTAGGTVNSSPDGISCDGSCSAYFDNGTDVLLTAQTGPNHAFLQWSGACSGTSPSCMVHLDSDKTAFAAFGLPTVSVQSSQTTGIVVPGSKVTYPVQLQPVNNFTGSVNLSCSGLPAGLTCGFAPNSQFNLANGLSQDVVLTLSTLSTTPLAQTNFSLFATNNGNIYELPLVLKVQNYTQTVSPSSASVTAGASTNFVVTYAYQGGMSGKVHVDCSTAALGVTCTPAPAVVDPALGQNQTTITLNTTSGTASAANDTITITGSAIGAVKSNNVTLSVKDFTLTPAAGAISTNVGTNTTKTIVVKGLNGFTGNVTLVCAIEGAPLGTNCTLSNANPAATSTGTSVTATITSTAATTPPGSYLVDVTGTTSGGSKPTQFTINVKDFTLGLGSSAITIPQPPPSQSSKVTVPITLTAENGFNSSTTLACVGQPTGVTCAFSPASGTPTVGGLHSTLTITGASTAAIGPHDITIKGTAGTLIRQQTLEVDLWGPNFTQAVTPATQNVTAGSSSAPYTVTFTPLGGMTDDIVLSCAGVPANVTCTPVPAVVNPGTGYSSVVTVGTVAGATAANSTIAIVGTSSGIGVTRSANIILSVKNFSVTANSLNIATNVGTNITDTFVVKGLNGFTGPVALGCVIVEAPAGTICNLSNANPLASSSGTSITATIVSNAAQTPPGTYTMQVTGTNSGQQQLAHAVTLNIKDFTLATGTGAITIPQPAPSQSSSLTVPITLTAANGFNRSTALSCLGQPTGITCAFSPASGIPTALGIHSILTVTSASTVPLGTYHLQVKATAGTLIRTQALDVIDYGPNFTQVVTPAMQNVISGSATQYSVTYTPLGNMTQDIAVGCILPVVLQGNVTCSANPPTTTPGVTGLSSIVTVQTTFGTTPPANGTIAITGTSAALNNLTRSNNVTVSVKDFSVARSTPAISTNVGTNITDTIVVKGLNGFTGNIPLTCVIEGTPAGTNCTLSNLNPAASSTGTSVTATITSNAATTPAGSYLVDVTGTTIAGSHTAQFTVNIKDFTLALNPDSESIAHTGGPLNFTATLTSLDAFNNSVTLSCVPPLPAGITCGFGPSNTASFSVIPTALGANANVRVNVANGVGMNNYPLTVRAISGVITRTQQINVNVTP
jgi:hypothetical protein